ncbi:flavin reductase family protein [Alkalihalobacillus sp. BA299]|uniref:flavin reductase family protein n=1 Tax=Alkalihalobacillus sp. BA299 TaxID=2815938 RepID=UPI001ADD0CB9|nr:flavin reductase family protein [Alkalihalobacillus sp. BA299]
MSFTSREFRNLCGEFMTGVTVVTTRDEKGKPTGLTANSFASVSLDPPMVLVCVDKGLNSHQAILDNKNFAIHILNESQQDVSNRFARSGNDKFAGINYTNGENNVPVLEEYNALFECRLAHSYEGGDHTIFVGIVDKITNKPNDKKPLGYFRGKYITSS